MVVGLMPKSQAPRFDSCLSLRSRPGSRARSRRQCRRRRSGCRYSPAGSGNRPPPGCVGRCGRWRAPGNHAAPPIPAAPTRLAESAARRAHAGPLRGPQMGFGNPQAPIVFISPSPLDAAAASNEAFAEWLDREATLEHHLTSETPHPYFQFVRAVLGGARRRLGLKPGKHDSLELAFHTWAVRCATENPDRVTDDALNQCVDRHLDNLMGTIAPRLVIAMGGPVARHLWWRTMRSWDGWGPMTTLHGRVLEVQLGKRTIPAILSVHPYQRGIDLHPDVIARAVGERIRADELQPQELKVA